jgi:hypothetical protein
MSADRTGASALELMSADGEFSVLDTGAILVRVEGGGGKLVAAIEMANSGGGNLYLENPATRFPIGDLGYLNPYVSHADYDGNMLAFIWSSTGTENVPEAEQGWRLMVQQGSDAGTRDGYLLIPRSNLLNGVGDLALVSDHNKVAVLYTGFSNGKWHYQLGLYHYASDQGRYRASVVGLSEMLDKSGPLSSHPGRILKVGEQGGVYQIMFSAADGVYSWKVTPGGLGQPEKGTVSTVFSQSGMVDVVLDALGTSRLALLSGSRIIIKDMANPNADQFGVMVPRPEGSSGELVGARIALADDVLALATPYGAASPFFLYRIQDGSISLVASCSTCRFLDVNIFKSFQDFLLASSISSGIEIYSIEGF